MPFITVDGHRLEYAWHGPGPDETPTLVFLHEGLGSLSMWRDYPQRVGAATGCGVLVYSRTGYGNSERLREPRSVRFMHDEADRVLPAVLATLGVKHAVLVGHSDGASIALIHAGRSGGGVKGLVLEAPHVFVEDITVSSISEIRDVYKYGDLRERLARHHGANVDGAFWGWNDVWLNPAFRDWNIEECLPGVSVPVLVIQGEDDHYGSAAQVEAVRRQVSGPCEVIMLPGCGHSPHRDQVPAVVERVTRFVHRLVEQPA